MRSLLKDFLAVFIAGTIFLTSAWLFYQDINKTLSISEGEEVGVIIFKKNTAQRKYSGRAVWENIDAQFALYNNDTIRTSTDSEAIILMNDGTEIILQDNTLIVLEWGGEAKNIEFLGGIISARSSTDETSAVQIRSADTTISLTDANVKIGKDSEGRLDLSVSEGNIALSRGDVRQDIGPNQKAFIERDTDIFRIDQLAVKPLFPGDNNYFLTFTDQSSITFTWEMIRQVENLDLQISKDADFNTIEFSYLVNNNNTITQNLPEGTWFWRFVSETASQQESAVRRFVVIKDIFPTPLSPSRETAISYRNQLPSVRFLWEQSFYADHYMLEIADNIAFNNKKTEIISRNSFNTSNLSEGNYYWRVTPHYSVGGIGYPRTGEAQAFTIEKNIYLNPVVLAFPPDKSEITAIEASRGINFKWREEREILSYQFYFSENPGFTDFIYNEPVKSSSFSITEMPEHGTYYWKVGGLTADNELLPHSEVRSVVLKPAAGDIQLLNPSMDEAFELPPLGSRTFNWESNIGSVFRFMLFKDTPDSIPVIDDTVRGKSRRVLIPASGTYFWQVSALDDRGLPLLTSSLSSFSTRFPLESPEILIPSENRELILKGADKLEIRWNRAADADFYTVDLVNNSTGIAAFENLETSETSIETSAISDSGEGIYRLTVKAKKYASETWPETESRESQRYFTVSEIISFEPPVPAMPLDNYVINREEVTDSKLFFTWNHSPLLPRYELSISDSAQFDRNTYVYSASSTSFNLSDLRTGRYFWRVRGFDTRGNETPFSKTNILTVEPLKPLAAPAIISPRHREEINMDNRNSITLRWAPSEGAEYYSAVFRQDISGSVPLFSFERFRGNEIIFSNLEKLDIGRFRFELQAFKETSGNEKRVSPPVYIEFDITLTQPDDEEIQIIIID